jgi:pantoate--beta-alanine ligase
LKTVRTIPEVRGFLRERPERLGLVPTMGYLHEGHLSLVRRARAESDVVAASIFVNPTQFGPSEDLGRYPRDLERDVALLVSAGCDLLFAPEPAEMYREGNATRVDVGPVAEPLEGARRPGHFAGVATVVLKLFNVFRPQRAYFGEKDAQQLAVIRRLVADLDLDLDVVGCPIVRDADGLALSSRNVYLSPEERRAAPVLHRALLRAAAAWDQGERATEALRQLLVSVIAKEPLARLDYAAVVNPATFLDADPNAPTALALLAVYLGRTRLIDNLRLGG